MEKLQPLTGDDSPREMLSAKVFDAAISALGDTLNLSAADEAVTSRRSALLGNGGVFLSLSASPTENCLSIPGSGLNCRRGENSHSRLRSVSVGCSASASLKVGSACARAAREGGSALGARGSRRRRGECPQVRRCARAGRGGLGGCGGSAREAEARTPLARARAHRRSHPARRAARAHLHFLNEPLDGCGGAAAARRKDRRGAAGCRGDGRPEPGWPGSTSTPGWARRAPAGYRAPGSVGPAVLNILHPSLCIPSSRSTRNSESWG
ncbi:uncharacterized protein LOC114695845 [Peromyscus leucopus]|uniref:uncharacterized protein LOC114695845 n=1 Tax=Peromyscus leucopus TaxID=10041 RepID=UPI001884C5D1|nr:uncharacterized protein LOC114695845 [Peromyscus leucopus]